MDYGKRDKYIVLSGLSSKEFFHMLKTQINCTLVFTDRNKKRETIVLTDRVVHHNVQKIVAEFKFDNYTVPAGNTSYEKLIEFVREEQATKAMTIEILRTDFQNKESIISLWGNLNSDVVENCVFIDYDNEVNMFSLINKDKAKKPERLYYFEDTEELLVFSKDGPKLYKKFTNVEDILC